MKIIGAESLIIYPHVYSNRSHLLNICSIAAVFQNTLSSGCSLCLNNVSIKKLLSRGRLFLLIQLPFKRVSNSDQFGIKFILSQQALIALLWSFLHPGRSDKTSCVRRSPNSGSHSSRIWLPLFDLLPAQASAAPPPTRYRLTVTDGPAWWHQQSEVVARCAPRFLWHEPRSRQLTLSTIKRRMKRQTPLYKWRDTVFFCFRVCSGMYLPSALNPAGRSACFLKLNNPVCKISWFYIPLTERMNLGSGLQFTKNVFKLFEPCSLTKSHLFKIKHIAKLNFDRSRSAISLSSFPQCF